MHDAVQTAMHRAIMILRVAKIRTSRFFLILRDVNRVVDQFTDSLVFGRGNRNDRNAECFLHLVDANRAAVFAHLVHHVECQHHRNVQLHQLHGQIKITLNIGRVNDIDDALRLVIKQELSGHNLLASIGRHGIDARKIGYQGIIMASNHAVLAIYGHARKVSDMLVGTGELVEQGRLTAILIACQREGERRSLRQWVAIRLDMVNTALAKPRVVRFRRRARFLFAAASILIFLFLSAFARICRGLWTDGFAGYRVSLNFFGVGKPQGQFITMNAKLHRVAHRRQFHQLDFRARYDAHIQKMLPQRAFAADSSDLCTFSNT